MIDFPELVQLIKAELTFGGLSVTIRDGVIRIVRADDEVVVGRVKEVLDETDAGLVLLESVKSGQAMLLLVGKASSAQIRRLTDRGVFDVQPEPIDPARLANAVRNAMDLQSLRRRASRAAEQLKRHRYELRELIDTARTISSERDIHTLLDIILEQCRYITNADAGSIYVIEGKGLLEERKLRFKLSQNDSMGANLKEFLLPISRQSIAGSASLDRRMLNIPDVHDLPAGGEISYDTSFDEKTGYRTCSMLTAPMVSQSDEVLGVVQLINRKRDRKSLLFSPTDFEDQVIPFDSRCEEIVRTLAAHAAVSLENAMLYDDIRRIFDGFVMASVHAIEQRDPTTSGHTERVAALTRELALAVNADQGVFAGIVLTERDMLELRYASLLHDFGKIGVREEVLTKPRKLPARALDVIRQRFESAKLSLMHEVASRPTLQGDDDSTFPVPYEADPDVAVEAPGSPSTSTTKRTDRSQPAFDLRDAFEKLDVDLALVEKTDRPTVLDEATNERLHDVASRSYRTSDGKIDPLLTDDELHYLSIRRGSLTDEELAEIRSHARKTLEFLSRIPWGSAFEDLPLIASSHHERPDGSGYPAGLRQDEIPIQARIMAVADVFDALTSSDRPYKKAVSVEKALEILEMEVAESHLDPDIVRLFIDSRVYQRVGRIE
jgi:HD-GYP domain-containing protein (c-di-GMP phosphodiesterase class II)